MAKLKHFFSLALFSLAYSQGQADCVGTGSYPLNDQCSDTCAEEPYAYTFPFHELECSCGLFATGEFLYWYGKETDLILGQKIKSVRVEELDPLLMLPTFLHFPSQLIPFEEKWDPGLRVGIGAIPNCDGWDFYVNWTYFTNNNRQKALVAPIQNETANDFLLNPWSNPIFGNDFHFDPFDSAFYGFVPLYTQMEGEWRERINIIDGEIGRKYYLSPCMTIRPFFGVRGAWDRNHFQILSTLEEATDGIVSTNTIIPVTATLSSQKKIF